MLGSHGLLFKGAVLYEELMNIPLLIRPPGGLAAAHCHRPAGDARGPGANYSATGAARRCPVELQGADIGALARGGDEPVHDGIALEYHSSNWGERPAPLRAWRTEDWKYVATGGGDDELYDLRADPLERHNLSEDPAAAAARERLWTALAAWLERTGDTWPEVPVSDREVPKVPGGSWGQRA